MECKYGNSKKLKIRDDRLYEFLEKMYESDSVNYFKIGQKMDEYGYTMCVYGENSGLDLIDGMYRVEDCGLSKHDGIWDGTFWVEKEKGKPRGRVGKRRKDETEFEFDERMSFTHQH